MSDALYTPSGVRLIGGGPATAQPTVTRPDSDPRPDGVPHRRGTARGLWVAYFLVVSTLLALRLPQTLDLVAATLPVESRAEVEDPAMLDLAVRIGAMLGLALYGVVVAVNGVIAGVLERRLALPVVGAGRRRAGLLFLVLVAAVVPLQVVALAVGHGLDKLSWPYLSYVCAVALLVPVLVHRAAGRMDRADLLRSIPLAAVLLLIVCAL